jgi:hypothetical protein
MILICNCFLSIVFILPIILLLILLYVEMTDIFLVFPVDRSVDSVWGRLEGRVKIIF